MRKLVIAAALGALSLPASAQWVVGGGYVNLSDDADGPDISLGGFYGSVGYRLEAEGNFTFMPELRAGFGVGDDSVGGADIELDTFLALSMRGQYDFDGGFYLFAQPSYARVEVTASFMGFSASDDEWEFGFGGGGGYKLSEQVWAEVSYEIFDDTDGLSFGVKYVF